MDEEDDFWLNDLEDVESPINQVTSTIIGAAIEVHRHLGPGFLEVVYEEALAHEFELRGIRFRRQAPVGVMYKGRAVGDQRLDFIVEDMVVLEIKAIDNLAPIHTAIVISYLKSTKKKLGLLINFNVRALKDGVKRIALR